jgi:hypothetical protein
MILAGVMLLLAGFSFAREPSEDAVWAGIDLDIKLGYRYSEWGYDSTPSQGELFERNVSQDSALKEIQLGFLFEWVTALTSADSSWAVAVSRLRYIHTEQTFFGEAVAQEPFAYARLGIDIIEDAPGSVWFADLEDIDEGESLAFRTEFVDDELSVLWPMELWNIPFNLRAGWYKSKWLRPSDIDRNWRLVEDDKRIMYETVFRSSGLVLGIEPAGRDVPGPNLRLTGHWGFDDDISNRVNRDYEIEEGKELQYASGVIDWWFNWVPNDRVLLTLGASWDRRVFGTEISLTGGTWDDEDLYSVYSSLRLSL